MASRVMGSDYDAAAMAGGHCSFSMGAMASMQLFTDVDGSPIKAFFVVPIAGSPFIDFFQCRLITTFMHYLKQQCTMAPRLTQPASQPLRIHAIQTGEIG